MKVCLPHELGPKGGVSLVKKNELVQVLRNVGQTTRPTAVVTTQPAHELYKRGAKCSEVWCTIQVPSDSGTTTAYVKRFLIQLGMDPAQAVTMNTQGLEVISQSLTMQKIVIRFDAQGGWDLSAMSAIIVSDMLRSVISETAHGQITIRSDGSATAFVHKTCTEKVLKHSGTSFVFIKPHVSEAAWKDLEILWLPESVTHAEAMNLTKAHPDSLGLARKQGNENVRYGLRFPSLSSLKQSADKLGLGHVADLGRFKITAICHGTGPSDVSDMMHSISWPLDSIEYVGEGHAIVSSKVCPKQNKYCLERADGASVPMFVHALNSKARELFKAQNLAVRRVDAEGEELDDNAPVPVAPMSLEDKFSAAAAATTKQRRDALTSLQTRQQKRDVSRTPKRPDLKDLKEPAQEGQGGGAASNS